MAPDLPRCPSSTTGSLRLFRLLALALAAAALLPQFLSPAIPDVAWLLYSAGRLLDGARIPRDLVEINPPLIVWLNVPAVGLARLAGLPEIQVYRALVSLAALGSLLAVLRLVPGRSRLLAPLLAFVVFGLPAGDFGEREHLMVILALPYVAAVATRAGGTAIGTAGALAIGAAAGLGLALKPYFLALPLALEGWLVARGWRPPRPELLGMLAVFLVYALAIAMLAPGYLEIARLLGPAYLGYLREPILVTAVTGEGAGVALCALLAAVALRRRLAGRPALQTLVVATAAFFLSALLQQKGWRYHFYPAMTTGLLLLAGLVEAGARTGEGLAARVYAAAAAAVLVFVPLATTVDGLLQLRRPRDERFATDPDRARLKALVQRQAPGGTLLVLSSNMASAFPLVSESGARWASRFPSVWPLAAAYEERLAAAAPLTYRPPREQGRIERYLLGAVAEDMRDRRPDLVVVLRPSPDRPEWGVRRLDYLRYFQADSSFAREFEGFGFLGDVGEYRVYRRAADGERPAPPPATNEAVRAAPVALRPGLQVAPPGAATLVRAVAFLLLFGLALARPGRLGWARA